MLKDPIGDRQRLRLAELSLPRSAEFPPETDPVPPPVPFVAARPSIVDRGLAGADCLFPSLFAGRVASVPAANCVIRHSFAMRKNHQFRRMFTVSYGLLLVAVAAAAGSRASAAQTETPRPVVKVVSGGESRTPPEDVRTTILGPGLNQPDPFPGYGGFVGWVSPIRLRDGDWVIGFSAGYWHASPPTPLRYSAQAIAQYQKIGLPDGVVAPRGGRAMIILSADEGKTWSKPATMLDTPDDDRHPAFVELPDGTLIGSLFTYSGAEQADYFNDPTLAHRTVVIRSLDHGKTWDQQTIKPSSPFAADESDGPLVLLKDGSILLTISGTPKEGGPVQAAVFAGGDRGASWNLLAIIKTDHDLDEANATQLKDGRLVLMARPEGDICWSGDGGRSWTKPATFGMRMFAPSLYTLRDGTLVSLHGSYAPGHGGLRLIFSSDGGQTWIAPAKDYGFLVDRCYGYGKAFELPDGSLLVACQDTGGHVAADAKQMSLRLLRLRIRADHSGIDLLPVSPRKK